MKIIPKNNSINQSQSQIKPTNAPQITITATSKQNTSTGRDLVLLNLVVLSVESVSLKGLELSQRQRQHHSTSWVGHKYDFAHDHQNPTINLKSTRKKGRRVL